jgi:hypothetical protein
MNVSKWGNCVQRGISKWKNATWEGRLKLELTARGELRRKSQNWTVLPSEEKKKNREVFVLL